MLELVLLATATAFATGLGAIPVALLGERAEGLRPALLGLAAGVMAGRRGRGAAAAGVGRRWCRPVGAVIAYLVVEQVSALLPVSFAFAAGSMLALVAIEILPDALTAGRRAALIGAGLGAVAMLALSSALGV
jgi:zinc transporter ZupT